VEGLAAGDLNGDFKDHVVVVGGVTTAFTEYMLGNGDGTFDGPKSAPAYGTSETSPFIRDLNLDSRHDIGTDWNISGPSSNGGELALLNTSAKTNCDPSPANNLGVNVCTPKDGETVGSTFTFKAARNAFNGIAKRMELWIDGQKVGENLEDQLRITTTLTSGPHTAQFVAVDSFDNYATQSTNFTPR